jgi:hypothetical protein
MVIFTRKTVLWSIFVLASIGATFFSIHYFSRAFPIVNLDIRMSRAQALESSATLAKQHNLGPSTFKQAALFSTDSTVQTYVELEAGGAKAYNEMVTGHLYAPYTWQVRHFQPGETNELVTAFKPDGIPYGFVEKIAENTPGSALNPEQAEEIARKEATATWRINFNEYTRVEISKEARPNGRIDHTFVYERPDVRVGKATYRLRLVVSGDKLTTLAHFVKVPEEFIHHYQEMRSANNTLAFGAQLLWLLLYMIGIGLGGLYFLFRKKYLIWKTPLLWGIIVTTLTICASLSNFPLYWFFYETTSPVNAFVIKYLFMLALGFVINVALNTSIFMIAESLTRVALPKQGQLWKTWSLSGGSSWQVLARTISSYLLVPLFFADTVIFYLITMRYLGWWNPSNHLTEPNILSSYAPWLNAISKSLTAGFSEECLFRAFPLAAAILLGRRYGKEKWWIAGAFIIQILIFGAAHANYPTQPAYARLVELIIFSSLAGIIYLKFGLLIGIISHALYDLVWFSLPLFISSAPYAWVNQFIVIVIALLPLIIIIMRRIQAGSWHTLDHADLNQAWQPQSLPEKAPRIIEQASNHTFSKKHFYLISVTGIIGMITWLACTRFTTDAPALNTNRLAAEQKSCTALAARNITVDKKWTTLSHVELFNSLIHKHALPGVASVDQHRFVYQKGGKDLYKAMLGSYLLPAHWCVRFITFNGSVSDRAEEYFVTLADSGVLCLDHTLPEDRKGTQLEESEARQLAHKALRELYNRKHETLTEISAVSGKRPDRLDWTFTFADPQQPLIDGGQARIAITISGDQLTGNCRYIHVPEEWARNQEKERSIFGLINIMCISLLAIVLLLACIFIFKGTRFSLPLSSMLLLFGALLAMNIASTLNTWPTLIAQVLNTQEPYAHQLFRLLSSMIIGLIFSTAAYSYIITMTMKYARATRTNNTTSSSDTLWGISLGLGWAGLTALLTLIQPSLEPFYGDYSTLGSYCPACSVLLGNLAKCINQIVFILILIYALNLFAKHKARYVLQIITFVLIGFALVGSQPLLTINHFLLSGLAVSIFFIFAYYLILAYVPSCTPWFVATMLSCQLAQQAVLNLYPTAMIANICSIIIVFAVAWLWHSIMIRQD